MQRWLIGAPFMLGLALLVAPLTAVAQPTLTVSPPAAPPGSLLRISGTGFDPGATYKLRILDVAGIVVHEEAYVARPDGSLSESVRPDRPEPPGQYAIRVMTLQGTLVASATVSLVSGAVAAPATLPSSGDRGTIAPLLAGLSAALVGAGYALRRRAGH